MKSKIFLFLAFSILCLFACKEESTIIVSPSIINAPIEGGQYFVKVTCEKAWTATPHDNWISVSSTEGIGNEVVTISVKNNNKANDDSTFVFFADDENTTKVIIKRKGLGGNAISVSAYRISKSAIGGEQILQISSKTKWAVSSDASWVTVDKGVGVNNGTITVRIAPNTSLKSTRATLTISEYGTGNTDNKAEVEIYRSGSTDPAYYVFSVSERNLVHISHGNLQYRPFSKLWRFADNQYDYIGMNNRLILSSSYDVYIDLFGWGTGKNPTLASQEDSDYQTFTDWGVNPISNGEKTANMWRTLTAEEWKYLLENRLNADRLRSLATVNGVHGFLILWDYWEDPYGLTFVPDAKDWTTNTYSDSEWSIMETFGAIFLPTAGNRSWYEGNPIVYNLEYKGFYWSSTPTENPSDGQAFMFDFDENGYNIDHENFRHDAISVRLVRDAN